MKIAITGGTGLVGSALSKELLARGDEVIVLTRSESHTKNGIQYVQWLGDAKPEHELEGTDVVINLAGVSLNDGRWTDRRKEAIYHSRMEATDEVIRIIEELNKKPAVLINASAVGIYPTSLSTVYTEESTEQASDFLGKTVRDWEAKARQALAYGIRVVCTRFGVILDRQQGALPLMTLPYHLFVGGKIGSGKQWVSWVHIQDVVGAILYAIEDEELEGPVNVTSPNAKRMKHFGKTVGHALNRPHWLPVPSIVLKLALGQQSQLILEGQYVVPKKLLNSNYQFQFASLENAIIDLYNN